MKKFRVLIPLLIALCLCIIVGFTAIPVVRNFVVEDNKIAEQSKENEQTNNTKNESTNSKITESEEAILSAEDKAVKAEIAKYSDTKVDFRNGKQETIQGETYNVSFSEIEEFQGEKKLIAYRNNNEDEFLYNVDTGGLFLARIKSNIVDKSSKSIDVKIAQAMAENYIADHADVNTLALTLTKELNEGYFFVYSKMLGDYKTNATFEIIVGYNGKIAYMRNNTKVLDDKKIEISLDWVKQKKQEALLNFDGENAIVEDVRIMVENNKAYLEVYVAYGPELNQGERAYATEIYYDID